VITTSAVPKSAPVPSQPAGPKFQTHAGGATVMPPAARPVRQPGLFQGAPGEPARMEAYAPIRSRTRAADAFAELKPRKGTQSRHASELQSAFDFAAPAPNTALTKETQFEGNAAPLQVLLAGTTTDAAIIGVFTLIAAAVARHALVSMRGYAPGMESLPALAVCALIVAIVYKTLWALTGEVTPGLQCVGVELTGFRANDPDPSFGQRMVRILVGWLGLASIGLGLLYSIVDRHGLCWHDYASQSCYRTRKPRKD
jgi:hypothetical protein